VRVGNRGLFADGRPTGSRSALLATVVVFVLGLALAIAAAPASALTEGHVYDFTFAGGGDGSGNGQFEEGFASAHGNGVAVDESTGDVYVADSKNSRIQKFDNEGNFLQIWGFGVRTGANESQVCNAPTACQKGLEGGAPGQFKRPMAIAVDNSGGENDGAVYVADATGPVQGIEGLEYILKFDENGNFIQKIDGSESPGGPFKDLPWRGAIDIDAQGFLWVLDNRRVLRFGNDEESRYVGGSEWPIVPNAQFPTQTVPANSIAVNAPGSQVNLITQSEEIGRFNQRGKNYEELGEADGFSAQLQTDHSNGHVYVGDGSNVVEYDNLIKPAAAPFGPGYIGDVQGIGVNYSTNTVYVFDADTLTVVAFKKRVVPDVETGPTEGLDHETVTLTGEVAPDPAGGGNVSECKFEYGPTTAYGSSAPCAEGSSFSSATEVSADLTGLTMETTYHYRLVAANSVDDTAGEDRTFTPHAVLAVSTDPPSDQTPTSATLNGSFETAGDDVEYYFEWGPTAAYGNTTAAPPGIEEPDQPGMTEVSASIEGLSSYTKYHYRIVATNTLGTSHGEDVVVQSAPPLLPVISNVLAAEVTNSSATVNGSINPGFGETIYRVEYGLSSEYGNQTSVGAALAADDAEHPVSVSLAGLQPGTTYHFRVTATNFGGIAFGLDQTFTTQDIPEIESASSSAVTQTTATLGATVIPWLSPTTVRFEYGTSPAFGLSTPESGSIGSDASPRSVSTAVTGLQPGTTYHYRVAATNLLGTTYDANGTFSTLPAPREEVKPPPKKCKKGFVKRRGRCVKRNRGKRKQNKQGRNGAKANG
jgi:hypothetical protein